MNKETRKVYELMAEVSAGFIMRDDTSPQVCGILGEVLGKVLAAEYGDAASNDYVEVSLPIIMQYYRDATGTDKVPEAVAKAYADMESHTCPESTH